MVRIFFCSPKVAKREFPVSTSIVFSPLIVIFTFPEGSNFAFATNNIVVKIKITTKNTIILIIIVIYIILVVYNLIPEKLINPMAISPVMINVIPSPFKGAGTLE